MGFVVYIHRYFMCWWNQELISISVTNVDRLQLCTNDFGAGLPTWSFGGRLILIRFGANVSI